MHHNPHRAAKSALTIWKEYPIDQFEVALIDCKSWERDQDRHGIGTVQLSFAHSCWCVLVSQDLIDRVMPF